MHSNLSKDVPRFDIELLFDEIGVLVDDNQYRDAISLVDMYHFYTRQHQVGVWFPFCLSPSGLTHTMFSHFNAPILSLSHLSHAIPIWWNLVWTVVDPTSTNIASRCHCSPISERPMNALDVTPLVGSTESAFFVPFAELPAFRLSRFPFRYHIQTFASRTTTS